MFSFGKNKSTSQSQSTQSSVAQALSQAFDQSQSSASSYGENQSFSDSLSRAFSQGTSSGRSTQDVFLEDLFRSLYGQAGDATQGALDLVPELQGQAADLFNAGGSFLQSLQGNQGMDYMADRLSGSNPLVQENINALGGDIGAFLRDEINPVLTSNAVRAGGLGGSRQGVAQGAAANAALQQFQRGATGIRTADLAQRDQLAGQYGSLTNQAAGTGLGALGSLLGIGQQSAMAGMAPLSALAQIMGGPTVLTQSANQSQQTAEDFAQALARAWGFDTSESDSSSYGASNSSSYSSSYGQSTSSGRSSGFNFGIGG